MSLGHIHADAHAVVYAYVLDDVVGHVLPEAHSFALGVRGDGDLYPNDVESFEMQVVAVHVERADTLAGRLHQAEVEHGTLVARIGHDAKRARLCAVLVQVEDGRIHFFLGGHHLFFGHLVGAAANPQRVCDERSHARKSLGQGGIRLVERAIAGGVVACGRYENMAGPHRQRAHQQTGKERNSLFFHCFLC